MMTYLRRFPGVFVTIVLFNISVWSGCTGVSEPADSERYALWPNAVSYEIFVRAFADGSGDGIGDFRGLTAKLDYLQDLGVKGLWLMPIHPSPSYHKYNVTDYKAIHPEYGTMEDFDYFLAEAHKRDIRVVLDLVINHSSSEHPWFLAALADSTSPYFDFYVWERGENITSMYVEQTGPDSDNRRRWNPTEAYDDIFFYAYFYGGMPDLNFDNPALRDTIYDIGRFWLEKGVDGFRLDAAKHIFPDDRAEDNHAFWVEFRAEMEKVNPDVLLVGEVWASTDIVKPYLTGLRSLFNFDLGYAIMDAVRTGRGEGLAGRHAAILNEYLNVTSDFVDATFLTNHDQTRVMSELNDIDKARVAASVLLTLPGAPYLYYGEEIGMFGRKPDPNIREPMLWQPSPDPLRSRWRENRHSTEQNVRPVSLQLDDPESLLHHYRSLIHLRHETPALNFGRLEPVDGLDARLVAFERNHRLGDVLALHNVSEDSVEIELSGSLGRYGTVLWEAGGSSFTESSRAVIPANGTLLLVP
jgi:alpha-amylase